MWEGGLLKQQQNEKGKLTSFMPASTHAQLPPCRLAHPPTPCCPPLPIPPLSTTTVAVTSHQRLPLLSPPPLDSSQSCCQHFHKLARLTVQSTGGPNTPWSCPVAAATDCSGSGGNGVKQRRKVWIPDGFITDAHHGPAHAAWRWRSAAAAQVGAALLAARHPGACQQRGGARLCIRVTAPCRYF